jgi:next to BRCA1 gene 1 protein
VWRNATARSNDDLSQKPRAIHCYNCCDPVLDQFYHCDICENGSFDLCFGCVEDGVWCGGDNHELTKYYIIDNKVGSSEVGKLSLGAVEEKYKILPEGKS